MPGRLSEAVGLKKNGKIGGGADIIDAGLVRNGNLARACVDERCAAYRRTSFDLCFDIDLSSSPFWVRFQGVIGFNNSPLVLTAAYLASTAKRRLVGGACIFSISKLHPIRS